MDSKGKRLSQDHVYGSNLIGQGHPLIQVQHSILGRMRAATKDIPFGHTGRLPLPLSNRRGTASLRIVHNGITTGIHVYFECVQQ